MGATWILVANDSGARLYLLESKGKTLEFLQRFEFSKGRKKDQDLYADKPGRSYDSFGTQRHAMGHEVSPHVHGEEVFARELASFLDKELEEQHFTRLALVAAPRFLGELRKYLSNNLKNCLLSELAKDYPSYMPDEELTQHLRSDLSL